VGNNCLLSVNGTDFRIAMGYQKPFYSYKFKKSGCRYEVALCIKSGQICWWHGPFAPGDWNDDMIFKDALAKNLEEYEWCETDRGYRGSAPEKVKCPGARWFVGRSGSSCEGDEATGEEQAGDRE
jgi:hypothetical protein